MDNKDNFDSVFSEWKAEKGNAKAKEKRGVKMSVVVFSIIMVTVLLVGYGLGYVSQLLVGSDMTNVDTQKSILSDVLYYLHEQYYKDISDAEWQQIITNGGTAMMHTLDNYGYLLSPTQYYSLLHMAATDASSEVFGFAFTQTEGVGLVVHEIITDSVCYGIMDSGDIITAITDVSGNFFVNDKGTVDTSDDVAIDAKYSAVADISAVMANQTTIRVTVKTYDAVTQDYAAKGNYTLTRRAISNNNADNNEFVEYYFSRNKDGNFITNISTIGTYNTRDLRSLAALDSTDIGYIRIKSFESATFSDGTETSASSEFENALTLFKQSGKKRLILDLKGNPGGYVDEAVKIASNLIYAADSNGKVLVTTLRGRDDALIEEEWTSALHYTDYFDVEDFNTKKSIVVWVDGNSASASELLSGALLDSESCVLMGTTSYGKGIAQKCLPLLKYPQQISVDGQTVTSYYAVYFTFAKYYLPKGDNIHGVGLTPETKWTSSDYAELLSMAKNYFSA